MAGLIAAAQHRRLTLMGIQQGVVDQWGEIRQVAQALKSVAH